MRGDLLIQGFRTLEVTDRVAWGFLFLFAGAAMLSTAVAQAASIGIILSVFAGVVLKVRQARWVATEADLPLALLVTARILSVAFSIDRDASIVTLRTEIPFYALYFAAVRLFRNPPDHFVRIMVQALIAGGLLVSIVGAGRYLFGFDHRASSITSGYYTLGMYLTAVLALALRVGPKSEIFRFPIRWYATLVILLGAIVLTFNRIHWLLAGGLVLFVGGMRERRLVIVSIGLAVIAVAFIEPVRERFLTLLQPSGNLSDRDVLLSEGLRLAGDRPFTGYGTRTFHQILPYGAILMDRGVASWHNDMLQILLESGMFALLAYMWMIVVVLGRGFRGILRGGGENKDYVIGFTLVVLSVSLAGLTGIFFTDPIISPLMLVSMAFVMAHRSDSSATPVAGSP